MEHFIKSRLKSMWFNAEQKQIAVLKALYTIKNSTTSQDSTEAIQAALQNSQSELSQALNIRRFGSISSNAPTESSKQITKISTEDYFSILRSKLLSKCDTSAGYLKKNW